MTYTKEELRLILNSDITINRILEIIKARFDTDLPGAGNLCGQSVASAIFEILALDIKPIYNDIDIFYFVLEHSFRHSEHMKKSRDVQERRTNTLGSWDKFCTASGDYDHISYLSKLSNYKVVHSFTKGPINRTYVATWRSDFSLGLWSLQTMTKSIIDNFDINSTQVGISLDIMKLSFTEEFLDFLITKQLKITHWNTPNHSLIRLRKKFNELENVFINWEESKMLAMVYTSSIENMYEVDQYRKLAIPNISSKDNIYHSLKYNGQKSSEIDKLPLFFGKKHRSDYKTFIEDSDLYLKARGTILSSNDYVPTSRQESDDLTIITTDNKQSFFSKFLVDIKNTSMGKENVPQFNAYIEKIEHLFYKNTRSEFRKESQDLEKLKRFNSDSDEGILTAMLLPYSYNSLKNTRKKTVKHYVNVTKNEISNPKKSRALNTMIHEVELLQFRDLQHFTHNYTDQWQKLDRVFSGHDLSCILDELELKDWPLFCENILKISKLEFGSSIYGVLEDNHRWTDSNLFLDYDRFEDFFNKSLTDMHKILSVKRIDTTIGSSRIEVLNTKYELMKEGEDMNHCVGGYASSVRAGSSTIIKVSGDRRFTIELVCKNEDEKYSLSQVKGKRNAPISWTEAEKILFEVNKEFLIFPISNRTYLRELSRNRTDTDLSEHKRLIEEGILEEEVKLADTSIYQVQYQAPLIPQYDIPIIDLDSEGEIPF